MRLLYSTIALLLTIQACNKSTDSTSFKALFFSEGRLENQVTYTLGEDGSVVVTYKNNQSLSAITGCYKYSSDTKRGTLYLPDNFIQEFEIRNDSLLLINNSIFCKGHPNGHVNQHHHNN
ncbi:hypothetical protein KEM09_14525 [Carboxylicivirga mesophila]|uniref:C-type lysozyme inhibitor domain-containing protein n=1 Tax=Carboxylicivirga mesophila TaxID=1166478 RepID=A0ABS5KC74_9BACT|nr:hypothetical protein [Carboxylicivirga mesophila]MBS2212630.1 hypothetical protein [Carboxylicivirga mesophila]